MREPLIDVRIAASEAEVWSHLRDPALVRTWFGWDYEGLDEEIASIFGEHAEADEAARTLAWAYGPEHADRFQLHGNGDASRLVVTRETPDAGDAYDVIAEGWITFAQQLRFALERHPGEPRRTVHLSSPVDDAGALPVARTLGLEAAMDVPPGGRYEARVGPGDPLSGTVWFRTAHQLGVTVDELGNALLVVWEKPAAAAPPHGEASLTLSVYGSARDRVDDIASRWPAWWADHIGAGE